MGIKTHVLSRRGKTTRARKTAGYKNIRRLEFTSLIRSLREFRHGDGGGDESVTPIDETLRGLQGAFKILSQPKLITAGKTVMLSLRQCIYIIYINGCALPSPNAAHTGSLSFCTLARTAQMTLLECLARLLICFLT